MQTDLNDQHLNLPLQAKKELSYFEFWPAWLFYLPIYLYVGYLMIRYKSFLLPTAANPHLADGAFCGDSKSEIFKMIDQYLPEFASPHLAIHCTKDKTAIALNAQADRILEISRINHIEYPFVLKPEYGCRGSGVCLIKTRKDLLAYLQLFPGGEKIIIHQLIPYEHEAGVFYCRLPGQKTGQIISLTLKYFPTVCGDGIKTLQELIMANPRASRLKHLYFKRHEKSLHIVLKAGVHYPLVFAGNHSKGTIFKDGRHLITSKLENTFDTISKRLPEFYFGRFDVRFKDFKSLEAGVDLKIVEINGASAESTHIWDSDYSLIRAYKDLFKQFDYLFKISANNTNRGFKTQSWRTFYKAYKHDKKLSTRYPGTH